MTIVVMVTLPSGIYTASIITLELSRATSRVIYNDIYVTSHSNPSNFHKAGGFFSQPFRALEGIFTCYIDLSDTRWSTIGKGYLWHLNMPKIVSRRKEKVAGNLLLIVSWLLQEVPAAQSGKTFSRESTEITNILSCSFYSSYQMY